MLTYQKLKVVDLTKIKPNEPVKNVLVIGTEYEDEFVDEIYFKVGKKLVPPNLQRNSSSGFLRSVLPLRFLNDMCLYRTVIKETEDIIIFVEPHLFEKIGASEVSAMIQVSDLAEKTRKVKLDPIKEYYLSEPVYYELIKKSREKHGHQYLTAGYLSGEKIQQNTLESLDYRVYENPLVFRLNRKQLLFLARENFKTGTTRLLETNSEGKLFETARFQIDGSCQFFCEKLHCPTDLVTLYEIILEIENIHDQSKREGS